MGNRQSAENQGTNSLDKNVADILESSMIDIKEKHKEVFDLIIKNARDGFFEEHQTSNNIKKLASEIIRKL